MAINFWGGSFGGGGAKGGFGTSFWGFKPVAIKPVKNKASVGTWSVASMPTAPKKLKSPLTTTKKTTPMQSTVPMMSTATGAKPWYIKKWPENMMSTPTGAAPWYIKKWPEQMMSVAPKSTPAPAKTTPSRTTTSTASSSVVDRNATSDTTWNSPDIERGTSPANTPMTEAETPTPTETPPTEPTTTEWEETPPDYVGQDIALTQAEYMQQSKEQEEFLRNQRSVQTQIDTLSGEMQQLQSSELIRKTSDDLDKLKHNIAYLGKQWQPWESAVKMEAISKQVADAERVFMNLKKLETDKESMRTLGLEYDANAFERQMVQMQNDLNTNVNMAIQEALNGLNAAEMKGEMDTIEDVEKLRGTLFQNLDKAIAGKVVANATDRKLIIDRYNQVIAEWEAYVKNKSVVNKDLSAAMWYYIDGNGNPLLNAQGGTIAMPKEAPMEPIFDKDSGNLLTFSTWADGKIVTTVQKVLAWQQAAGEPRKQASDGTYYRTNAQGQLETSGTWQPKQLTLTEKLKLEEQLANGTISQEKYNQYMYGGWTGGQWYQAPVSWYTWPAYKAASVQQVQQAFTQAVSQWDGARGGQCWSFVNNYLQDMGIDRLFKDPIDVKKAVRNSTEPTVWSIAIMDSDSQPAYGHVGIVTSVNADGTVTLKQSNKKWEEKVFTSKKNISDIYGFFDPQIPQNEALMSGGTAPASDQSYLYEDFVSMLPTQWAQAFNSYSEEDKLNVMQIIKWDALVSDIAKGSRWAVYAKKLLWLATKVDPNFSENTNKSRYNFLKNRDNPTGKSFINRTTINTALWHTAEMAEAVKGLDNKTLNKYNSFKNLIKKETGNPNIPDFEMILTAIAWEMAWLYKGASPTDQETEKWYNSISSNYSPKTLNQLMNRVTKLASDRIRSMTTEYKSSMWRYPDEPLVQDYFLQQLKASGINTASIETIPWSAPTKNAPIDTSWIGRRQAAQQ